MCLTSLTRTLLEVMSTSGHSSSAFSSNSSTATLSTDKNRTLSANRTELTIIEAAKTTSLTDSGTDSAVIHLSSSTSNFKLQEHNMPPLSGSTTESMENIIPQRDVMSFDVDEEVEVGELFKKDNAKSAFEITSVRPANTDDHDRNGIRNPVSNDSLRVIPEKGESGESDYSLITADDKRQVLTTDMEDCMMKAKAHALVGSDPAQDEEQQLLRVKNEVCKKSNTDITERSNVIPSGAAVISEDLGTGGSLGHPVNTNATSGTGVGGGGGAVAGNGSSVQPNRFRRVNQYERGRWTVRDSLVTEEQAETTTSASAPPRRYQPYQHQLQDQSGSDTMGNSIPAPRTIQQQQRVEQTTDLPQHQISSVLVGLGSSDATSDKDSSSIHMDRNSTAAETLSRNTSLSSIIAPEKSIDEDESEVDSISGGGCGAISNLVHGHEQELSVGPTTSQPPVLATLSVGAVPPPSSTTINRVEQSLATALGDSGKDSNYDEVHLRGVKNAMSLLQVELDHILTNSSNASLIEENRTLKAQNALMVSENTRLQNDISKTKEKLLDSEDKNLKLMTELSRMRSSLSQLLTRPPAGDAPPARVEAAGHSELQAPSGNTLSSHETTGTNPSQGYT